MSNRRDEYNKALKGLIDFYESETIALVKYLYRNGYTQTKIANILDRSLTAVILRFPKSKLLKEGGDKNAKR